MNEQNCRILNLIGATILLLAVSAYRQLSIRYLQGDFVRPYIVYAVYIFLLLNWQYFISTKITQKMMSFHLTAQNIVCIFYITVRFVQDAFLYVDVQLMRFTGYFIHILVVLGPLFGLYGAFYLGKSEDYRINRKWYMLLIPAFGLIAMALTNEYHHFLFYVVPEEPQPNLYFHPYIGTYLTYLWGLGIVCYQVYVIYKRNEAIKTDPLYKKLIPFYEPILLLVFSVPYAATAYVIRFEIVELSAGLIFIAVLCWNLYIFIGLIPVNTCYGKVFRKSTVAMQILSSDGTPIVISENASNITPQVLEILKRKKRILTSEDIEMNIHNISNGYMIWQNDLSEINQVFRKLQNLNIELEQKQDLLAQEIRIKSNEANIQVRNDIYDQLTTELSKQLCLLEKLLPEEEHPGKWDKISLIGTYIKRFCNLQLTYQENQMIPNNDLRISLEDMAKCMRNIGLDVRLIFCPTKQLEPQCILYAMKRLEEILEESDFRLSAISICVSDDVYFEKKE